MGATFAAKHPKGLRKLVISNSPASIGPWVDAYNTYRLEMPQELQDTMKRFEDAEDWDNEDYQNIMINHFYKKHMCTVTPWPEELTKSFEWAANDMTVALTTYGHLSPIRRNHSYQGLTDAMSRNGPSEFEVTGGQRNWSAVESAKKISVPTLVINGTAEGATDEAVRPFVEGIKGSKWVKFKNSTHMPMYEERKRYFDVLKGFLLD